MSFLSSSRCVLILGDEGLQIFNVGRLNARLVDVVPWETEGFETSVRDLLVRKCKRKPVVILNDMVEQHYRKERVPKVGIMDRANVLKRRLNVAFPNYKIRAALKLDERSSNLPGDNKGLPYLFAAVPTTDAFTKTMQAVRMSNATILGFYLLPIEASAMVKALSAKISKGGRGKATWAIFMGQHQNGGVRQIVTRNGELALTRMTPIVDTDVEPDLWAKEISSELNATMSYLSRFGYSEADGLNVIIIANESVEAALESTIEVNCNLEVLTSEQAGKVLGANIGQQNDFRYADPLHAAYLGKKSKFRLPMQVSAIDSLTKPRRIATFVVLGLLAAGAYFGFQAFNNWTESLKVEEQFRVSEERKKSVQQEYDLELARKKEIGFDFLLVSSSVEIFNKFKDEKIMPLYLMKAIAESLGTDLTIDDLNVQTGFSKILKPGVDAQNIYLDEDEKYDYQRVVDAVITLSFNPDVDPDIGVRKTNELQDKLQRKLARFDVKIIKQVADLSYTGNFVGEAGVPQQTDGTAEDYLAEISIRGPVR